MCHSSEHITLPGANDSGDGISLVWVHGEIEDMYTITSGSEDGISVDACTGIGMYT